MGFAGALPILLLYPDPRPPATRQETEDHEPDAISTGNGVSASARGNGVTIIYQHCIWKQWKWGHPLAGRCQQPIKYPTECISMVDKVVEVEMSFLLNR